MRQYQSYDVLILQYCHTRVLQCSFGKILQYCIVVLLQCYRNKVAQYWQYGSAVLQQYCIVKYFSIVVLQQHSKVGFLYRYGKVDHYKVIFLQYCYFVVLKYCIRVGLYYSLWQCSSTCRYIGLQIFGLISMQPCIVQCSSITVLKCYDTVILHICSYYSFKKSSIVTQCCSA